MGAVNNVVITIVAWWGASLSTVVFAWDIYKWFHQGPKLNMVAYPNMRVYGDRDREEYRWISVTVSNRGDRPATITTVGFEGYPNLLAQARNKQSFAAVVPRPSDSQPLPHVLQPGTQWLGLFPQDDEIEKLARTGRLCVSVHHSHRPKPLRQRILIPARTRDAVADK